MRTLLTLPCGCQPCQPYQLSTISICVHPSTWTVVVLLMRTMHRCDKMTRGDRRTSGGQRGAQPMRDRYRFHRSLQPARLNAGWVTGLRRLRLRLAGKTDRQNGVVLNVLKVLLFVLNWREHQWHTAHLLLQIKPLDPLYALSQQRVSCRRSKSGPSGPSWTFSGSEYYPLRETITVAAPQVQ